MFKAVERSRYPLAILLVHQVDDLLRVSAPPIPWVNRVRDNFSDVYPTGEDTSCRCQYEPKRDKEEIINEYTLNILSIVKMGKK
jgi:hypothetical protein